MWGKFLNKVNYSGMIQLCVKGGKEGRKGGEWGEIVVPLPPNLAKTLTRS